MLSVNVWKALLPHATTTSRLGAITLSRGGGGGGGGGRGRTGPGRGAGINLPFSSFDIPDG